MNPLHEKSGLAINQKSRLEKDGDLQKKSEEKIIGLA